MYCKHCGKQIDDDAKFCPYCGSVIGNAQQNYGHDAQQNYGQQSFQQPYTTPVPNANKGLVTAAKVFIILGIVIGILMLIVSLVSLTEDGSVGYFLLQLVWLAVGIVFGIKAITSIHIGKPATAVCVCVLIFTSLIGGILLLCTKPEDYLY